MKQKYAVVVLFALIIASSMVSLTSYKTTENLVTEDGQRKVIRPDYQVDRFMSDNCQTIVRKKNRLINSLFIPLQTKIADV